MADILKIRNNFSLEVLEEIGLLFVTSSSCEHAISMHIARLLAHPNTTLDGSAVLILNGAGISVKLQQLSTLAHYRLEEPHRSDLIAICNRLSDAYDRRNDFAHHAASSKDKTKVTLSTVKHTSKGLVKPKTFTADQIRSFSEKIHKNTLAVDECLTNAGVVPMKKLRVRGLGLSRD